MTQKIQKTIPLNSIQEHPYILYKATSQARAMYITPKGNVWFANSLGQVGLIEKGELKWKKNISTIEKLDLRSIAVLGEDTILVANAGSPAYIFQSLDKGKTWQIKYSDKRPEAFFDAMYFIDSKYGYVWSDPMGGCFPALFTQDGGAIWREVGCNFLPNPKEGEAAFAASNSIVNVYEGRVCAATGGAVARLVMETSESSDMQGLATPIIQGKNMQGIFSMDISKSEQSKIIVAGGDYENQEIKENTIALSKDGGLTWTVLNTMDGPSFVSCVKFHPKNDQVIITAGKNMYITYDQGKVWHKLLDGDFNVCDFDPHSNSIWYTSLKE